MLLNEFGQESGVELYDQCCGSCTRLVSESCEAFNYLGW